MKITNKYNLPEAFLNAIDIHKKPKEKEISVTDLINPPLMYYLKLKHWDEIEEDISERLWALLGSAIHNLLMNHAPKDSLAEEKIVIEYKGWKIKGRPDLYNDRDKSIEDYKVTSVYSFLLGDKKEWIEQLNCYAWLYEKIGFKVEKLFINAILRDWVKSKVNEDYPEIPFARKEVPLWSFEERENFVSYRIQLFENPVPQMCTDEERWVRGGEIALKQFGRKNAIKLFQEVPDIKLSSGQFLEQRPKRYVRCEDYCQVRNFCEYREKK